MHGLQGDFCCWLIGKTCGQEGEGFSFEIVPQTSICTHTLTLMQTSPYGCLLLSSLHTFSSYYIQQSVEYAHKSNTEHSLLIHPKNAHFFIKPAPPLLYNSHDCLYIPISHPKMWSISYIHHGCLPIPCRFTDPLSCFNMIIYTVLPSVAGAGVVTPQS